MSWDIYIHISSHKNYSTLYDTHYDAIIHLASWGINKSYKQFVHGVVLILNFMYHSFLELWRNVYHTIWNFCIPYIFINHPTISI